MTRITIEIDGPAKVNTSSPTTTVSEPSGQASAASGSPMASMDPAGAINAGSAPDLSVAMTGPVRFTAAASAVAVEKASALSAGTAPENLFQLADGGDQ